MNITNSVTVLESTPGAVRLVFGAPVPTNSPRTVPLPPAGFDLGEGVRAPVEGPTPPPAQPWASARVLRTILARVQRHPVGAKELDEEQRARRVSAFESVLRDGTPAEVPEDIRYFVALQVASIAFAHGLTVEDAIDGAARASGAPADEVAFWVDGLTSDGAFYGFDSVGDGLDHAAAQAQAEADARTERERLVQAAGDAPNKHTAGALGVIAFEVRNAKDPIFGPLANELAQKQHRVGERIFFALPRAFLLEAEACAGPLTDGVDLLEPDFVLPGSTREVDAFAGRAASTVRTDEHLRFLFERMRPATGIPLAGDPSDARDETTEQGRACVASFERYVERRVDLLPIGETYENAGNGISVSSGGFTYALGLLFEFGTRGHSLADDVVAGILHQAIVANWARAHRKPAGWDAREAERAATGLEFDRLDGPTRPYAPRAWVPPPLPAKVATEEALLAAARAHLRGRKARIAVDELFEPAASFKDRVKAFLGLDPVVAKIREVAREGLSHAELEEALREAGLVRRDQAAPSQVIHREMKALGYEHRQTRANGKFSRRWMKASTEAAQ